MALSYLIQLRLIIYSSISSPTLRVLSEKEKLKERYLSYSNSPAPCSVLVFFKRGEGISEFTKYNCKKLHWVEEQLFPSQHLIRLTYGLDLFLTL
ncbi:hypothetical protein AQUCO_00300786v1 [Aquilegia coerulea]|uniref:Uncharacterized protein n=1 Tax=Aquilegia coerulea TaxID=218851 RepID=A0A2G5F0G3_AQUCA|nr:hypothetical protein AQUCO_00300786v1 [Aquilegia coerulea]